jgi:hypothetical protein
MKLTVVLAVLIGTLVLACSAATPAPAEPTPNIDATVEAKLAQERAVDATVEARLKEERASQPTSIPGPTNTQDPMPTYTPYPTYTPHPTHTPHPTYTPQPPPTPSLTAGWYIDATASPISEGLKQAIALSVNEKAIWPGFYFLPDQESLVGANQEYDLQLAKKLMLDEGLSYSQKLEDCAPTIPQPSPACSQEKLERYGCFPNEDHCPQKELTVFACVNVVSPSVGHLKPVVAEFLEQIDVYCVPDGTPINLIRGNLAVINITPL